MFYVLTNETSDYLPTSGDFSCYWYVDCLVVYCKDRLLLFLKSSFHRAGLITSHFSLLTSEDIVL